MLDQDPLASLSKALVSPLVLFFNEHGFAIRLAIINMQHPVSNSQLDFQNKACQLMRHKPKSTKGERPVLDPSNHPNLLHLWSFLALLYHVM